MTFCVEGLAAREELLFKSFVLLLDHMTHQQWSYQPAAANQRIDLLVVAEGVELTLYQSADQSQQPVLRLGSSGANGHGYLSWPLKPGLLEVELNRLGGLAIKQRGVPHVQALFTGAATAVQAVIDTSKDSMRLLQWPPARLLAGVGRMRLATLLTGKAMQLDELVRRSALSVEICQAFVLDLQRANLLTSPSSSIEPAHPQPALQKVKQPGGQGFDPQVPGSQPALQKVTQPGLFDRIRLRLGIKSPSRS